LTTSSEKESSQKGTKVPITREVEDSRHSRDRLMSLMREGTNEGKVPLRAKIYAFLLRGAKTMWSYRGFVALDIIATSFQIAMYFLVGFIINPGQIESAGYGSSFFTFALVGVAFQQFVFASVNMYSHSLRHEQEDGTIEALLTCKTSFQVYLIGEGMFNFTYATYFVAAAFVFGILLFPTTFTLNILSLISVAVLTLLLVVTHLCIGIAAVGIIMKVKEGDPILWAFSWFTQLLSGVMYPLSLLPSWLIPVALGMPLTYALDGLRRCLIQVDGVSATLLTPQVFMDAVSLLIFLAIALPISLRVFKWGYDVARRDGTLHSY
jgi:ABC-2 type transport system permease protein